MFFIKLIICILIFVAVGIVSYYSDDISVNKKYILYTTTFSLAIISLIIKCIPIQFTVFTIPKLILFLSICLDIWYFVGGDDINEIFTLGFVVVILAYFIALCIYIFSCEKCEPDIKIKKTPIVPIVSEAEDKDCYILYELSTYKYCHQAKDKGNELSSIPSNNTKIYYIKDNEDTEPYLEITTETLYTCYNGDKSNHNWSDGTVKTYKLYIPENSVRYSYYEKEDKENKKEKEDKKIRIKMRKKTRRVMKR